MDLLNREKLLTLLNPAGKICLSLYMPTYRKGEEQKQHPIVFRNLVAKARDQLRELGLNPREIDRFLAPLEPYFTDRLFWQFQSDGLAIFLSADQFDVYRLPLRFDPLVNVSSSFHIKPIIPLIAEEARFYILAISMNETRLLQGSRFEIEPIDLADLPTSKQEALWTDEPEKYLGYFTSSRDAGAPGLHRAIYYGHGARTGTEIKTNLLRYFQIINQGIRKVIGESQAPLILAGVEYLLPIYHQANDYPHLLDEGLIGSPEQVDEATLHRLAWEIVEPIFLEEQNKARRQVEQLLGQGSELASTDLHQIAQAARNGRVGTVFLALGVQRWGRYDETADEVVVEEKQTPANQDLLDRIAIETYLNSGMVYAVPAGEVPGGGSLAAILRY